MSSDRLMTAREVATYLSCSASTVRRMAASGEMPHYRLGRLVRFRREEVDSWLVRIHRGASGSAARPPVDIDQLSLFVDGSSHE